MQEGHDYIQQVNKQVNKQVNEPIPISHQRAPPTCSRCQTIRYTRRSCPNKQPYIQLVDSLINNVGG